MLVVPFDRPGLQEPTWENLTLGEEFGPLDAVITNHAVKSHAYALDDYHPWYLHDSPPGGPIAPSTLLLRALLDLFYLRYDATRLRGVHARQELEFFGPIRVGQPVRLHSRVSEKFVKRGECFVVFAAQATKEDGQALIRSRQTVLLRSNLRGLVGRRAATPEADVVSGAMHVDAEVPIERRGSRNAEIGALLRSITKKITLEQIFAFSVGVPNIHTDRAIACESGLTGPIAQGLMSTGYISQLLVDFFGVDWFESGWSSHAFIRPVSPGDILTVQGRIRDRRAEPNGTRLVLDVWCRNQMGDLTTVGSASALISR